MAYDDYKTAVFPRSSRYFWNSFDGQSQVVSYSYITSGLPQNYVDFPGYSFASSFTIAQRAAADLVFSTIIPSYANVTPAENATLLAAGCHPQILW